MKQQTATPRDYNANSVIERGYEIFDEWNTKKTKSRTIVSTVEGLISRLRQKPNIRTSVEALAYVFALDTRIKERYGSFLKCLFSYFAWRRETRVYSLLKRTLRMPNNLDVRTAIEVEIQKLQEKIEQNAIDEDEDGTRGGKTSGHGQEEKSSSKNDRQMEAAAEETPDSSEAEETLEDAEEIAEEIPEAEKNEPQKEEVKETAETKEASLKEEKTVTQDSKQQTKQEAQNTKNENNGSTASSEPSTDKDKQQEAKTYHQAEDYPLPAADDSPSNSEKDDGSSHIYDILMDELIKNSIEHLRDNTPDTAQRNNEDVRREPQTADGQKEKNDTSDKDAHLFDKERLENNEPDIDRMQSLLETDGNTAQIKREFENMRVPLQVDMTVDTKNQIRRAINDIVTENMVKQIYQRQAEQMREQLTVASAQVGIDAPVEIIGRPDSHVVDRPSLSHNRK